MDPSGPRRVCIALASGAVNKTATASASSRDLTMGIEGILRSNDRERRERRERSGTIGNGLLTFDFCLLPSAF